MLAAVAVSASLPALWPIASEGLTHAGALELLLLWAELAVIVVTMAIRRAPQRVMQQPRVVALVLLSVYWPSALAPLYVSGNPVVARWLSLGLALTGFALSMWARWALGRNIGLLPAQRQLVVHGPYRFIRHPIYASLMISILGAVLSDFSPRNAVLDGTWVALLIFKALAEERFLCSSPEFAAHFARVPDRWIPLRMMRSTANRAAQACLPR